MSLIATANQQVWRNARIMTMADAESPFTQLEQHDIIVENGIIQAISPVGHYDISAAEKFDLKNQLVTPGLIDCHTHLVFGGSRAEEWAQRQRGASYEAIAAAGGGIRATVKDTRSASEEALYDMAQQRLSALINEGVTSIEIKSGYGLDLDSERKILNVIKRLKQNNDVNVSATLLAAHTTPPEFKGRPDDYITYVCDVIMPQLASEGLYDAVDVFCKSVGFSLAQTERLFQAAIKQNLPIKGHMDQLSNLGGSTLVAQLDGWSVDHAEYLQANDIEALAKGNTVVVLLPGAFYFLREKQQPPIAQLRAKNIPMAIATDFNPGTSPFLSLRLMMNMACVLFGLTPEEAWLGVTRHAAQALGQGSSQGCLQKGYAANFCVWQCKSPVDVIYEVGRPLLQQRIFNGK